jgi:DNA-binding PadR family transcriptional regulator
MENALLGLLNQGAQHGYSLHQQLSAVSGLGLIWRVKQSQLYAFLEKLEAAGYITSNMQPQDPYPPRRVYSLTNLGKEIFEDWVTSPVRRPHQMRQIFMAKFYFARLEGEQQVNALIEAQSRVCDEWLDLLAPGANDGGKAGEYDLLVRTYRLAQVQMIRSFLAEIRSKMGLQSGEKTSSRS